MSDCVGCKALADQVVWLRQQLERAQDQHLALLNPVAYAQMKGQPAPGAASPSNQPATIAGPDGKLWVQIGDKAVPAAEYEELMKKAGYIDNSGKLVPADEARAGLEVIDRMMSGQGFPTDGKERTQ